jgi:hypothetical protein
MEMGLGVWSIQERKKDGKKDQQKIFQFVKINLRPSLITTSDHLLSLDKFIFMVSGNPFLKDPYSFFLCPANHFGSSSFVGSISKQCDLA